MVVVEVAILLRCLASIWLLQKKKWVLEGGRTLGQGPLWNYYIHWSLMVIILSVYLHLLDVPSQIL